MRLALISHPWSPITPSIQLGILKSHLEMQSDGTHQVDIFTLFLELAALIGIENYQMLAETSIGTKLGNMFFQHLLYEKSHIPLPDLIVSGIFQAPPKRLEQKRYLSVFVDIH